jgi:hypothetical protein
VSADKKTPQDEFGCVVGMWAMFVTTPMYLAILFSLMTATNQPTWAWVLFWCYVPAQLLLQAGIALARVLKGGAT